MDGSVGQKFDRVAFFQTDSNNEMLMGGGLFMAIHDN